MDSVCYFTYFFRQCHPRYSDISEGVDYKLGASGIPTAEVFLSSCLGDFLRRRIYRVLVDCNAHAFGNLYVKSSSAYIADFSVDTTGSNNLVALGKVRRGIS